MNPEGAPDGAYSQYKHNVFETNIALYLGVAGTNVTQGKMTFLELVVSSKRRKAGYYTTENNRRARGSRQMLIRDIDDGRASKIVCTNDRTNLRRRISI